MCLSIPVVFPAFSASSCQGGEIIVVEARGRTEGFPPEKRFEWRLERGRLLLSANNGGKKGLPFFLSPPFLCGLSRLFLATFSFPLPSSGTLITGRDSTNHIPIKKEPKFFRYNIKNFPFPGDFFGKNW